MGGGRGGGAVLARSGAAPGAGGGSHTESQCTASGQPGGDGAGREETPGTTVPFLPPGLGVKKGGFVSCSLRSRRWDCVAEPRRQPPSRVTRPPGSAGRRTSAGPPFPLSPGFR